MDYYSESAEQLPYLLFSPKEYGVDAEKKWPLIFFLHGAGERGVDLDILRDYGPAKEAQGDPNFPFILDLHSHSTIIPSSVPCPLKLISFPSVVGFGLIESIYALRFGVLQWRDMRGQDGYIRG